MVPYIYYDSKKRHGFLFIYEWARNKTGNSGIEEKWSLKNLFWWKNSKSREKRKWSFENEDLKILIIKILHHNYDIGSCSLMPITTRHLAFERLFFWQRSLRVALGILPAMFYNLWFLFTKDSRTWKRVFWSIYHTKVENRGRFWSASGSFIVLTSREREN